MPNLRVSERRRHPNEHLTRPLKHDTIVKSRLFHPCRNSSILCFIKDVLFLLYRRGTKRFCWIFLLWLVFKGLRWVLLSSVGTGWDEHLTTWSEDVWAFDRFPSRRHHCDTNVPPLAKSSGFLRARVCYRRPRHRRLASFVRGSFLRGNIPGLVPIVYIWIQEIKTLHHRVIYCL